MPDQHDRSQIEVDRADQRVIEEAAAQLQHGAVSTWWNPVTQRGTDAIMIKFAATACRGCPVRDQCTRSTSTRLGRQLTVPPREVHDAQHAARAAQDTPDWQADYAR